MAKIKRCSCEETAHLRKALAAIAYICSNDTEQPMFQDLAQIDDLADQGLGLRRLEADPGVGDVSKRTGGLVP